MTRKEAVGNLKKAKCVPYKKETLTIVIKSLEAIPELGKELRKVRGGIKDKNVLIGYNMAVAICNKYLGEEE